MQRKNIRRLVKRQLKYNHPHWKKMKKKAKKKLLKQVVDEVMNAYDFSQPINIPIEELTGIEDQVPSKGIKNLIEMAEYINNFYSNNLFDLDKRRKPLFHFMCVKLFLVRIVISMKLATIILILLDFKHENDKSQYPVKRN